jgi:hypothetical protein
MIDLTQSEHEALRAAKLAGANGLVLGDAVTLSAAIRLGVADLVTITTTPPQRAIITSKGRAFDQRHAFA